MQKSARLTVACKDLAAWTQTESLLICDVFAANSCDSVKETLDKENIIAVFVFVFVFVSAGCTCELQPMDNAIFKAAMKTYFNDWYARKVAECLCDGG
jgi:hypothetical protein